MWIWLLPSTLCITDKKMTKQKCNIMAKEVVSKITLMISKHCQVMDSESKPKPNHALILCKSAKDSGNFKATDESLDTSIKGKPETCKANVLDRYQKVSIK